MMGGTHRKCSRNMEALSLTVSRLMRVRFGPIELPSYLKRGQMRELDDAEVARLHAALEFQPQVAAPKSLAGHPPGRAQPKPKRARREH
jgi:23S rRNA pseudouridine2605 synthase